MHNKLANLIVVVALLPMLATASSRCYDADTTLTEPVAIQLQIEPDPSEPGALTLQRSGLSSELHGSVCLTASPIGRYVAITEHIGSNMIETSVLDTQQSSGVALVKDQGFVSQFPPAIQAQIAAADHGYIEVVEWTDAGLQLHVFGHTPAYDHLLSCQQRAATWSCQAQQ